jgi:hypothetical protein
MRRVLLWLGLALGLVWLAAGAYQCARAWPSMPLDVSPNDPATRTAYAHAVTTHALRCTLVSLGPPLLLFALGWLGLRLKRAQP